MCMRIHCNQHHGHVIIEIAAYGQKKECFSSIQYFFIFLYFFLSLFLFFLFFFFSQTRPNSNVTARGLVVENPRTRDIIKFHSSYYKNLSEINFGGDVLVYVAPVSVNMTFTLNKQLHKSCVVLINFITVCNPWLKCSKYNVYLQGPTVV